MEENNLKPVRIKSKLAIFAIFAVFILIGVALVVVYVNTDKPKLKYHYVQGQVEVFKTEITSSGVKYVHDIVYTIGETEYVWQCVESSPKFYEGEKVNLKVDKKDPLNVQLDLETKVQKKMTEKWVLIVGIVFIACGAVGMVANMAKKEMVIHVDNRLKK